MYVVTKVVRKKMLPDMDTMKTYYDIKNHKARYNAAFAFKNLRNLSEMKYSKISDLFVFLSVNDEANWWRDKMRETIIGCYGFVRNRTTRYNAVDDARDSRNSITDYDRDEY